MLGGVGGVPEQSGPYPDSVMSMTATTAIVFDHQMRFFDSLAPNDRIVLPEFRQENVLLGIRSAPKAASPRDGKRRFRFADIQWRDQPSVESAVLLRRESRPAHRPGRSVKRKVPEIHCERTRASHGSIPCTTMIGGKTSVVVYAATSGHATLPGVMASFAEEAVLT